MLRTHHRCLRVGDADSCTDDIAYITTVAMQICENIARHVADIETKLILRILVGALALWRSALSRWLSRSPSEVWNLMKVSISAEVPLLPANARYFPLFPANPRYFPLIPATSR